MNYHESVRTSLFAKIALGLADGAVDMSTFKAHPRTDGRITFTESGETFGMNLLEEDEDLFIPGVNVLYLNTSDKTPLRKYKKEWLISAEVSVARAIAPGERPFAAGTRVRNILSRIIGILNDGQVELWDYSTSPGVNSTHHAHWVLDEPLEIRNDSVALEGGHIAYTLVLYVSYTDRAN
jgi:hypothetical protein